MMTQPVPSVSRADVERVVRRDYPAARVAEVFALLERVGSGPGGTPPDRVHLAALKLASGDIERLSSQIDEATIDYRDVLAPAEYPAYMDRGLAIRDLPADERQRIIDADWDQYQEWLARR